jgi:hypothetical protein
MGVRARQFRTIALDYPKIPGIDEFRPALAYCGEPTQIAINGVFDALATGPQEAPLSPRNCA